MDEWTMRALDRRLDPPEEDEEDIAEYCYSCMSPILRGERVYRLSSRSYCTSCVENSVEVEGW